MHILRERSQFRKTTYYVIPTIKHSGKDKTIETVKRSVGTGNLEQEGEGERRRVNR